MFLTWKSLGSEVHMTDTEVSEWTKVCVRTCEALRGDIDSIPVDNAARHVAYAVADNLKTRKNMNALANR